ncbi:MAG TPA: S9 family peptidase [Rhodothermales bacterium]|nr:S9 family peptidase [Rhodothermales bacterium]
MKRHRSSPQRLSPLLALIGLLVLFGCETEINPGEAPEGPREVAQYSIEDFLETTSYTGASFAPDNSKILVSNNETGIFNAYALPLDGGAAIPLTNSTDNAVFAMGYFPNDERFLYTSDQGGNELNHIYVQTPDSQVTDLTPGDNLKANFLGWADDDASFFVGTNERDNRYFDVYEVQVDGYDREMIYENNEGYTLAAVSPDKRYLALNKTKNNADSDIYLYDRETQETTHLTPHEGDVTHSAQTFSPDGTSLYYLTNKNSEFQYLVRRDLAGETTEPVVQEDWDVWYAYFSQNGKYFVVGINKDARTELRVHDAATMEPIDLPDIGGADITSVTFSDDEEHMAFYASSARMPSDLFAYDFEGEPEQLTHSLNANINGNDLVEGKVARFDSYDGVEVPGILYKPHQASAENPVPALVWVHGGPGGQSRIGYNYNIQYLVNHGYAVYAINNRGSSGYGKTFFHMDDRKHGDADLDDVVESKTMLAETGWIDPERIGIIGGSYGGYMTLAALTFRPEAFDVGVDLFGISNWHRTVTNIPPWWESFRASLEMEMGDFDDEEFFKAKSPLFHADQIVRPLMVLQGANDPRVLKVESDEIVEAVKANGVPVEYVLFEDEGHGFVKKENQAEAARRILGFLDTHLKNQPEVTPPAG